MQQGFGFYGWGEGIMGSFENLHEDCLEKLPCKRHAVRPGLHSRTVSSCPSCW